MTALPLRNILVGTGWQLLSRLVGASCTLGSLMLLRRAVGEAGFGVYQFFVTLLMLATALVDFGGVSTAVREIASAPERKSQVLRHLFLTRLLLSLVAISLLSKELFAPEDPLRRWLLVLCALRLPLSALSAPLALFQAELRFRVIAASQIIGFIVFFAGTLLIERAGGRMPEPYLVAWAIGLSCQSIVLFAASLESVRWIGPVSIRECGRLLREMAPLGITAFLAFAYLQVDTVLIRYLKGDRVTGAYNDAFKIVSLVLAVPTYYGQALLPLLSKAWRSGRSSLPESISRSMSLLLAVILPAALMAPSVAPQVLRLVWGECSADSVRSLYWWGFASIAVFLTCPLLQALIAFERQRDYAWMAAFALLFKIIVGIALIEFFGAPGAAISSALAEWLVLGWALVTVRRVLGRLIFPRLTVPLCLAAIGGALALALRHLSPLPATLLAALVQCAVAAVAVKWMSTPRNGWQDIEPP